MSAYTDANEELTRELRAALQHLAPRRSYPAAIRTAAETHHCRICGAEREGPEQVDVTALRSTFSTRPGRYSAPCPTPKCGEVCKICRREVGDVHGPDCGPLMFGKLERPHIVDQSDCR